MRRLFSTLALAAAAAAAPSALAQTAIDVHQVQATHAWQPLGLAPDVLADAILLGQVTTYNGTDPGSVRIDRAAGQVRFEEHDDGDHDFADAIELIALRGDLSQLGGALTAETGQLFQSATGHDHRIPLVFTQTYTHPVVFVQVASRNGLDPFVAHVDDVTSTGAQVVLDESSGYDGSHTGEFIHYAVFEAGTYTLNDGRVLEVGTSWVDTSGPDDFDVVPLQTRFYDQPALVTAGQSTANPGWAGTRLTKAGDGHDIMQQFRVRHMRVPDATVSASGHIGYLAIGTPWTFKAGRVEISKGNNLRGFDVSRKANGTCFNFSDANFGNQMDRVRFESHHGRTEVSLYSAEDCTGAVAHHGTKTVKDVTITPQSTPWGNIPTNIQSMRVSWSEEEELPPSGTRYYNGDVLLETDGAFLTLEDLRLRLFKTNEADGTLREVWSSGPPGAEINPYMVSAVFGTDGRLKLQTGNWNGGYNTHWSSEAGDLLKINASCNLKVIDDSVGVWDAGASGCNTGAPPSAGSAAPEPGVAFLDLDGDGDEEMVFVLAQSSGRGAFFYDPVGIADLATLYGLGVPEDFRDLLSATQQDALTLQLTDVLGAQGAQDADGPEVSALLEQLNTSDQVRSYRPVVFREAFSGSGVATSDSIGPFTATASVGNLEVMIESDEFGPGFAISASVAQYGIGVDGVVEVTVTVESVSASFDINKNSFTIGASADLISVSFALGDTDGSYVGFDAGVGAGFWADAAFGRNDQYGFALAVPILPVGIAIYVKGGDAKWIANQTAGWSVGAAGSTQDLAEDVWAHSSGWVANTDQDIVLQFENMGDGQRVLAKKVGGEAVLIVGDTSKALRTTFQDASALTTGGLDTVGDALGDGTDAMSDAVSNYASSIAGSTADTVGSVVNKSKKLYRKVKKKLF